MEENNILTGIVPDKIQLTIYSFVLAEVLIWDWFD
jgi:hypothetical protein